MKRRVCAIMLATAMTVSLAGCGGGGASSTGESTDGGSTNTSTDINVMLETDVESLDPQQATDGTSFEFIADYTDGLMQMDEDGQPVNALAESYETSDDGLTWTFKIRDDANWSNGEAVTADDFVFGWQRAVDPDVASEYSYMLSDIGQVENAAEIIAGEKDKEELGVKAVDPTTLEVKLNAPVPYFLSLMYFPTFYPMNQAFFEEQGDNYGKSADSILANGAFKVDKYEPSGLNYHLVKNEDYYDADKVSLSGISYQVIQDSQQALQSYQAGDLDMTLVNGEQVDQVQDDDEFTAVGAGYLWYVSPNMNKVKELANEKLRQAMTLAIDREAIATDVLKDGSKPTYTAVPMDFATGPDGSDFSEDQKRFEDVCRTDVDKAKELWAEGLKEAGVTSLDLEMVVDSDDAPQKVAQVLKEQWETNLEGLTVTLKVEPKKNRVEDMQQGNFEIGLTRWGPDYADPMTYLGMWKTGNSNNYGEWSNKDYDAIIDECTTGELATDEKARWEKLYDAEKIVMDESVIFPLYTQCNAEMVSSKISGVHFHPVALNRVYKATTKSAD